MKRYRCYFSGENTRQDDQYLFYCVDDQAAWIGAYEALSARPAYDSAEIWSGTRCIGLVRSAVRETRRPPARPRRAHRARPLLDVLH